MVIMFSGFSIMASFDAAVASYGNFRLPVFCGQLYDWGRLPIPATCGRCWLVVWWWRCCDDVCLNWRRWWWMRRQERFSPLPLHLPKALRRRRWSGGGGGACFGCCCSGKYCTWLILMCSDSAFRVVVCTEMLIVWMLHLCVNDGWHRFTCLQDLLVEVFSQILIHFRVRLLVCTVNVWLPLCGLLWCTVIVLSVCMLSWMQLDFKWWTLANALYIRLGHGVKVT